MFGLGMPEILLILAIALIVIGPKKLPELAKTLGRAMGEFKRSAQDFKESLDVDTTLTDVTPKKIKTDLKDVIKESVVDPMTKDVPAPKNNGAAQTPKPADTPPPEDVIAEPAPQDAPKAAPEAEPAKAEDVPAKDVPAAAPPESPKSE